MTLLGLRYLFMVHMCCPLGLHWRRPVAIERLYGIVKDDGRCRFCGATP